jgi:hypothetical protein
MKITIESTEKIVHVNGVPARIWEGQTESGILVACYVTRIAIAEGTDSSQFEKELLEQRKPSPEILGLPARLIL